MKLKPWHWAVLASVVAHALLVSAVFFFERTKPQHVEKPAVAPAPVRRVTRVSLAGRSAPAAAAPSAPVALPSLPVTREGTVPARPAVPAPSVVHPAENPEPIVPAGASPSDAGGVNPAPSGFIDEQASGVMAGGSDTALVVDERPVSDELAAALHGRLADAARRCYPAAARRFQQRGTTLVSFCLDANGAPQEREVVHSSGSALLDDAAIHCVVNGASPFPAEGWNQCFQVPVCFGCD